MLKKYKKIKFLKGLVVCGFLTTYLVLSSTSINNTSIKQNQNVVYSNKQDKPFFNTYVDNSFYLNEVNYWHYDEPEAQVTRVNTLPILFKISTLNIIATPNTKNVKNLSLINNFKQITEYQTSENSGSYSYKSTKDEEIIVVDLQRILPQYLSFNIKRDNFDWGRGIANVVLDVKKTWNPESSVNLLDSNIVYVDDKATDSTKHTFWFDKGFSKDLYNTKYHVWSLPYIYAKEIQFIYVAYN